MSLVTLVAFLLLFPCAFAQGPEQKPSTRPAAPAAEPKADRYAIVYIYRHKVLGGPMLFELKPSVYLDDQEIARMDDGRYFVFQLEPGRHSFRAADKRSGGWLSVKPGETYYLRYDSIPHVPKVRRELGAVLPEQATYELKNLRYLDADKISSALVLVGAPGAPK